MKVLVLGGTGLTGPYIVRELLEQGHDVTIFHRGSRSMSLPGAVKEVRGDLARLDEHRPAFEKTAPDIVIHMMALTRPDAEVFLDVFNGIAGRAVVISSGDVYLAFGRIHGTEPGAPEPWPLAEDAPLRTKLSLGGANYDKLGVEEALRAQTTLPVTVLRYPAVYGPGDFQQRFGEEVRRMAAGAAEIAVPQSIAGMLFSHAYAEDAAHATVLAATTPDAVGRTYNVAERETPPQLERLSRLAAVLGWHGRLVINPDGGAADSLEQLAALPGYVAPPDLSQPLVLDSSRIRAELGYHELVSEQEGLRRTAEWLLENPPASSS